MANTKSIQKVLEYLKQKKEAVSTSEICLAVSLKYKTIKEVLEVLALSNQVIILATEKGTTLIKYSGDNNGK